MVQFAEPFSTGSTIRAAGMIATASGIISAVGVAFLIAMFAGFAGPFKTLGLTFGQLNDICVAVQYLLAIPLALALYRILLHYNPVWIRLATIVGIGAMILVTGLQLLLIFKVLTFEQQVPWVTLAMIVGVGFWLVVTGLAARSTGKFPKSVLMSLLAVPYIGYPLWAFWLGTQLLEWAQQS